MKNEDLLNRWLDIHNRNYLEYYFNQKEPRWHTKQFFLQSYYLFQRLKDDGSWDDYIKDYHKIFLRDPNNDWYGRRSPVDKEKAWENSIEWTNTFFIIRDVGFPYNRSSRKKMSKNLQYYIENALSSPFDNCHDFMICSAIEVFPKTFSSQKDRFIDILEKNSDTKDFTPHQLMAYLKLLKNESDHQELKEKVQDLLISWINNPEGSENQQVLIWARLLTNMGWWDLYQKYIETIKINFNKNLKEIHSIDWNNISIILEAVYISASPEKKMRFRVRLKKK